MVRTVDTLNRLAVIIAAEGDVILDRFDQPRTHPAVVEARQLRIALARLQASLRLPDGDEGDEPQGRHQRRVGVRGTYKLRSVS